MHEWKLASYLGLVAALTVGGTPAHSQTIAAGFTPGAFKVSETGAAEYRIAIRVPPGISGMEPKLALVYSSQGGNSMLGIGWALSGLSGIHRCGKTIAQDGLNVGVNYSSSDRYCLDGQRLVAVSGIYGAEGTEYRTELESFTKVVSHGTAGSGPEWFEARTKNGLRLEFGNTSDSRIEAQGKASVRAWAVNRISDVAGNSIKIEYAEDQVNGDFHPDRIDYTENAGQATAPFASVRFTYEARSDNNEQYVGGSVIRTMERLTSVETFVGEAAVTDYQIAYDDGGTASASRITSIKECTGDGLQCFQPVALEWNSPSGSFGYTVAGSPGSDWTAIPGARGVVADANGDSLGDLIYSDGSSISIRYSTGTGFGSSNTVGPDTAACLGSMDEVGNCLGQVEPRFGVGDVNGDGKADIVSGDGNVYLSTGSGFQSAGIWGPSAYLSLSSWPAVLADFNGDGLADFAYGSGESIYVAHSTGSSFTSSSFLAQDQSGCLSEDESGCTSYYAKFGAGDVNGDARADIVTGAMQVFLSNGSGFSSAASWGTALSGIGQLEMSDVNGDGRADVVYNEGTDIYVRQSTGIEFNAREQIAFNQRGCAAWNEVECSMPFAIFAVGDFNADGLADVVSNSTMYPAGAPVGDRVELITESIGDSIDPEYSTLSDGAVYSMESGAVWPVRDVRPEARLYVVASVAGSDGIGGTRTTHYAYRGARVHAKGGGFLGFRQIESVEDATGLKSLTVYRQDYPHRALPLQSQTLQSSGSVVRQVNNAWADTSLAIAAGSGGNYRKSEITQSIERTYELSGSPVITVTTTTGYDAYGNATSVEASTGDGYSKATENDYANDAVNWLLGRLTESSVTSTTPSDSKTRTSSFAYSATNGLLSKEVIEPDIPDLCLATEYSRDAFGNKTSATTRNCNGSTGEAAAPTGIALFAARTSDVSYAPTTANPVAGQFPSSSSNALGHGESKEFDARFGTVTKLTGPNGLVTTWTYDGFGRKVSETRADGTSTTWSYSACGTCPANGRYLITVIGTGKPITVSYFDILNREIRTEVEGFDGTFVRRDTEYDSLGHVSRVSQPYYATSTPIWTSFTYDVLGRVLTKTAPNNAVTTTTYNGLITTVTNALNQTETRIKNSQGQLVQVTRQ